jgi:hypothetical protein
MKLLSPVRIVLIATILLVGLFSAGLAQTTPGIPDDSVPTITTGLPHENAGAGGLASRSPGNMVNAGVASAQNAVKFGRTTAATITATAQPGPFDLFLAGAVDMILKVIEDLVLYFQDLFFARIGLPPIDSTPDNGNDNDNGNTNVNENTNENDNSNGNTNGNDNGNTNSNSNLNNNENGNTSGTDRPGGLRKLRR